VLLRQRSWLLLADIIVKIDERPITHELLDSEINESGGCSRLVRTTFAVATMRAVS
jgi:hypothetical protein